MLPGGIDDWLDREWLLANGRGAYASSTIIGCPTRRHHGWLLWDRPGILARWVLWAHAAEHVVIDGRTYLLSNFEFNNAIDPHGYQHLSSFEVHPDGPHPSVEWVYQVGPAEIRKRLWLDHGEDRVSVRYEINAKPDAVVKMQVWPLIACREADQLRRRFAGELFQTVTEKQGFSLRNRLEPEVAFAIAAHAGGSGAAVQFIPRADWWYNFRYRQEAARGLEWGEDLYVPGSFVCQATGPTTLTLIGEAATADVLHLLKTKPVVPAASARIADCDFPMLLRVAARQCLIEQPELDDEPTPTILAGYPWLESYGRDTCVALPGILLERGECDTAAEILNHLADLLRDGLLPNHVTDDACEHEYTAADEPLWFVYAVDAWVRATGGRHALTAKLLRACCSILDAYIDGTRAGVGTDRPRFVGVDPADGLVTCGRPDSPATWMDARCDGRWVTPRAGKPVEVNALWYFGLRCMAGHMAAVDAEAADRYTRWADKFTANFATKFWSEQLGWLADVVTSDGPDLSLRPNQLLAISLAHSALHPTQMRSILRAVTDRLLTPYGLRTLDPQHPDYRGRYEGHHSQRESAAHQGSVYPWLIGPFVEAYLRVDADNPHARATARSYLTSLIDHMRVDAGLGGISELFDGDAPHTPRGCINQAWCVAEVLRAWRLTEPNGDGADVAATATVDAARTAATAPVGTRP